jgi:hypothetical protein
LAWQSHLDRGQSIDDVQTYLLGSSEYYNRSRNDPDQYLQSVHRTLYGDEPTADEMNSMRQDLDDEDGVRSRFVRRVVKKPQ